MLFDYDDSSIESIMQYAKKMTGKTYNDMLDDLKNYLDQHELGLVNNRPEEFIESLKKDTYIKNTKGKGQLGNFIEKIYFGYEPNSDQEADLSKVGIEIKQTPIDIRKNGTMTAGERLSITMISNDKPVVDDFYQSDVWHKIEKILLIHYIRDRAKNRLDYEIKYVNLFTPSIDDLKIIIDDYERINRKIKDGKAHELSEADTMYLGACTKGASASKSLQPQYYNPTVKAKRRNFCFKRQYMDYVLNNYVIPGKISYESLLTDQDRLVDKSFEEIIIDRLTPYYGKTDEELCELFDRPYNNNKAQWNDLAYRMLGIKGNHAKEFKQANITVKIIRIEESGKIRENMSFPPFKFLDIANQDWEDSDLYNYFEETRFFFVIYQKDGRYYKLSKCMFWNMPYHDLNQIVQEEWLAIKEKIIEGVKLTPKMNAHGPFVENDFPKKSQTKIIHVRPHATKAAYKLHDGFTIGDISKDANILPSGEYMTTQSFWINNSYILKIIRT